ncbi:MAG TPA: glycosyltransferase family 2 protein [Vicinamibacteria bacterium]|jgi:GT2 family glycosyltransferase
MQVSVIIVSYNAKTYLGKCLRALYEHTKLRPLEVIVVDNASTDGSLAMLARDFPEVKAIASPDNIGFSGANNIAMREAKGEFYLLLNNDAVVARGAVDTMLRIIQEKPEVGVLGPLLRNEDGSVQISYGRMISFHAEAIQRFLTKGNVRGNPLVRRYIEGRSKKEAHPDWVSGACMMLRAETLETVGLFDDRFFLYSEEVDLCERVRRGGYRVFYTPEAEVIHVGGKSAEANPEKAAFEYRRSQLYFYSKHYGRGRVLLLKAYLLVSIAVRWLLGTPTDRRLQEMLLQLVWKY